MQPLRWYAQRLRAMGPAELAWRLFERGRDQIDRRCAGPDAGRQRAARLLAPATWDHFDPTALGAAATAGPAARACRLAPKCRERLAARAARLADRRLWLFGREIGFGDAIDWNCDPASGRSAPLSYAPAIDYRDFELTGDCKWVWEPNRHQHLVVLGRAYRATGERAYAEEAARQLAGWLEQCPFRLGMNWRSPLELAIRLINWTWVLALVDPAGVPRGGLRRALFESVALHVHEIARRYSRGSSANNHLIGEAAGVYLATRCFTGLRGAEGLAREAQRILCREILRQTGPDGGTREQATGYHGFVLQFLLLAGLAGRRTGQDFPAEYWLRLERMFEFLAALGERGLSPPAIGDGDDGYVLDLDDDPHSPRPWLCAGAVLYRQPRWVAAAGPYAEAATWLLGPTARAAYRDLARDAAAADEPLRPRAFPDSGYYLLQSGRPETGDEVRIVFDCGPLGLPPLAAHGHADALSFTLRAGGVDVFVDPGTFDYFTYPEWRAHFRRTRAHNTVEIDGCDQSEARGPFLWGRAARARCLDWTPDADAPQVTGEHDGYGRLRDALRHRRTLRWHAAARRLTVRDELLCGGAHQVRVFFHLGEHCRVARLAGDTVDIQAGTLRVQLRLDPRLALSVTRAGEGAPDAWISRGYHQRTPGTTLCGQARIHGRVQFDSEVVLDPAGGGPGRQASQVRESDPCAA